MRQAASFSEQCFSFPSPVFSAEGAVFDLKQAIDVSEETPNAPWRAASEAGPESSMDRKRIACGRTARLSVTRTGRAENNGKADGCLNSIVGPTGPLAFWQSSSKRFRLHFAAGFRGLRNAVPFYRIKAKKIPIVQTNFNFLAPKVSLKIFIKENQMDKKVQFLHRSHLVNGIFLVLYEKQVGTAYSEVR
ncbi:hypothetical protein GGE45_004775 [Rhizobium aethiopicum]|uniref:Uncharacterized protein n=1 Tax=Rhizobium aethiopicum TaxID=1138170 RepID=A0A7W6QBY7_9HYPH|nr:hypothetical protein [Rhizobium aethiopicum]MBB4194749.1 hypothetical protein [Rhizobium aethiopicum]MBB4582419.1 hypothetical protein [Rhizobium aethiopicum]